MFLAIIENINISVNPSYDKEGFTTYFKEFIEPGMMEEKLESLNGDVFLYDGCEVLPWGVQRYPYGFQFKNKYKIYFASKTGDNYPIYVTISAMALHMNNVQAIIEDLKNDIERILKCYDHKFNLEVFEIKMSRLDICNHNTEINLKTYIKPDEYNTRTVTRIRTVHPYFELKGECSQEIPYFRYGSGDVCVRFYNKIKEVCEQQYKPFFIKKWLDDKLIDENTFKIYESCYKSAGNYRLDYMYYNIKNNPLSDEDSLQLEMIRSDLKMNNDDKYDAYKWIIKKNKLKCVPEVINVEFQLRSAFLRSLKLKNDKGENIDYTNIYEILQYADILYQYLTTEVFRVVKRESGYGRKRDKEVDAIWLELQQSKIKNVGDLQYDANVYREYNSEMDKVSAVNKTIKNMANVCYQTLPIFNDSVVDMLSIDDLLNLVKVNYDMNENFYNMKYQLFKQIKYYGIKEDPGINLESDNEEL